MIKYVYLDVGGVVIRDFSGTDKWDDLENELGITSMNRKKFQELWHSCKYTRNTIFDIDALVPTLIADLGLNIPGNYSLLMGFVTRFEENPPIWAAISHMRKEVPIGLLTNQYPRMLDKIRSKGLMPRMDWDAVIDSSVVHMQKPDAEIYGLAEQEAKVKGDGILFVDNSQTNLDTAAREFGWQTFLYDPSESGSSAEKLMEYFDTNK